MTAPLASLSPHSLAEIAALAEARKLPPVDSWHPARGGEIDIRIARDGSWYHEGDRIEREALVRLFSTILRRESDGGYVLVTPAEKLAIEVEDAPFVAVEMKSEAEGEARTLAFRLNTGDLVVAGPDHPLALKESREGPLPYLHVRGGLDALVGRAVYYELADLALAEDNSPLGLWSDGAFFALDPEQ
ncbi:DUF1285 domain-containing protein [Parasphingopyxis marina]|uniref:DUF1285 domain-containing protein n=1 Tax=Parasphingopyxis marina TaxID=2761622 RepID=A0A842HZP5_9SPHN|nr:DUF1285 domain-containing protein [Parasphingopyxis marina]MBC2778442.1 DUF1285 domain-containing protein [Parasphingopyxis marina]